LLEDFLQYCDLAKFAKWQLSPVDMAAMYESARMFILETRPQPVTARPNATQSRNGAGAVVNQPEFTPARS
jgi:hypothetical protein